MSRKKKQPFEQGTNWCEHLKLTILFKIDISLHFFFQKLTVKEKTKTSQMDLK